MRFISLGLAAAIGLCGYGIEPARAQTWNLYDGGSSLYLPYASGGEADSPKLHVGFDNSSASTLFTMDTGSVGIVASPDNFQPGAGSKYLGPGQQIYSSTGIIENGSWYTATQQIYGDVNGHREVVATAEVPVLLVTSITCQTDARHCTPTSDPTGISIMGVGFARESSTTTDKTPNFNPFLNLTSVRLTSDGPLVALPANWNAGYVVTSEGVQLGLSSANTANAGFVKLRPDPQYSTPGHPEWRPARMDIDVNGARGSGNVLMDTGVGVGYLNPPGAAVIGPLVQCPGTTDVRCAPNGTHIAVSLPGQTGEVALFRYDIGSGNVMQPEGVIVDDGSDVFFNTSRYVLQGLDYIYDAANGFIGYRWSGAADTDGHVTPMLALENDFIIPAGFSTSYPVTLFGDTRLIPQGVAEFDNVISGDERLVIDGPGRVILTAENDYTGETQIKSGTLSVNGSVDSHILVESGGTLGGTGELRGNVDVHAGGIYAPGNSIGTEVVRGNLHFDRGGIYAVELDASRSDKAEVHGSIDLTGAVLQLMIARGNYAPVTTYEIIDNRSGAPAAGQFSEIVNPLVFFLPTVNYASGPDDDVVLALVRSTDYSAAARTPNELAVATALERLPQGSPLIDAIQFQTLDGARQAFNALSGEVHATTAGLLVDQSRYVRQTLLGRLLQAGYGGEAGASLATGAAPTDVAANPAGMMTLGAGGMALGAGGDDWGAGPGQSLPDLVFWTKAYGAWGSFEGNGNAASASRTLGGVLTGADTRLEHGWRLGFATGYSQSSVEVDGRGSSASVDTVHLAAYAGGALGPAVLRSGAAWGWNSIDTTRAVVFPGFSEQEAASYDGDTGQVFGELALPTSWLGMFAEPFAGLAYVHVGSGGFAESGPLAGLTGAAASDDVGYSTLGLRLASTSCVEGVNVTSRASAAWQHAFGDVTPEAALAFAAAGSAFVVGGVPIAEDSALLEAGLDVALSPAAMLEVSYFGQLAAGAQDNAVEGRFKWAF